MAANDTVIRLIADLELSGGDAVAKQIKKIAKDAKIDFDDRGFLGKWGRVQKKISSGFGDTIGAALRSGLSASNMRGLTDTYSKLSKQIEKAQISGATEAAKISMGSLDKQFKREQTQLNRISKRRMSALAEAQKFAEKGQAEIAEDFTKSIASAFGDLKSGNLAAILKGAGKGSQGVAGKALQASTGEGKTAKVMGKIGKFLSNIGPALLALGAVAGILGALVTLVVGVDSKVKELNKTLLDSGVAGAEMAGSYGDVEKNLKTATKAFTNGKGAFAFNRIWGTTAKDHLEILGAYSQAGLTFKEIAHEVRGARTEMEALQEATSAALTYSKLLGVSATEISGNMASWMEDLSLKMDGVKHGLSAITAAAVESGFGVKRFFGMVLQATSGMSMYNVRLAEAGSLLTHLGDLLGAKKGGEFLGTLAKGFKDESLQDSTKRVLTTKGIQAIIRESSKATARDFLDMVDTLKPEAKGAFEDVLKKYKITSKDPHRMLKQVGRLYGKRRRGFIADAKSAGGSDLARAAQKLAKAADDIKGGLSRQAIAMENLDMTGVLQAKLAQAREYYKGKSLQSMGLEERMSYEGITGVSRQEFGMLANIEESAKGGLEKLRRSGDMVPDSEDEKALVRAHKGTKRDGKVFAARVDKSGNVQIDKEIKNLNDYLRNREDLFRAAAKQNVGTDKRLAQDLAANTTEISKILEQGLEYWLIQINDAVQRIAGWVGGLDEKEKKRRGELVDENLAKQRVNRERLLPLRKKQSRLRGELSGAEGDARVPILKNLKAVTAEMDSLLRERRYLSESMRAIQRLSSGKGIGSHSKAAMKRQGDRAVKEHIEQVPQETRDKITTAARARMIREQTGYSGNDPAVAAKALDDMAEAKVGQKYERTGRHTPDRLVSEKKRSARVKRFKEKLSTGVKENVEEALLKGGRYMESLLRESEGILPGEGGTKFEERAPKSESWFDQVRDFGKDPKGKGPTASAGGNIFNFHAYNDMKGWSAGAAKMFQVLNGMTG